MFSSLLSLGAGLVKLANVAMGWFKSDSDQNIGRQLEQTDDLKASVKADQNAEQVRTDVDGLSHQQLVDSLRGPPNTNS